MDSLEGSTERPPIWGMPEPGFCSFSAVMSDRGPMQELWFSPIEVNILSERFLEFFC